jgi:hypothetical protein
MKLYVMVTRFLWRPPTPHTLLGLFLRPESHVRHPSALLLDDASRVICSSLQWIDPIDILDPVPVRKISTPSWSLNTVATTS